MKYSTRVDNSDISNLLVLKEILGEKGMSKIMITITQMNRLKEVDRIKIEL